MPVTDPLYVGGITTDLESFYNDWTRLIEELRRIRGRLTAMEASISEDAGIGQIVEYVSDPNIEGSGGSPLFPALSNSAALAVKKGGGIMMQWNTTTHVWIV
jgi:hypothetical protein